MAPFKTEAPLFLSDLLPFNPVAFSVYTNQAGLPCQEQHVKVYRTARPVILAPSHVPYPLLDGMISLKASRSANRHYLGKKVKMPEHFLYPFKKITQHAILKVQ